MPRWMSGLQHIRERQDLVFRDAKSRHVMCAGAVEQQALLPTHADPKLWIVECRPGEEREAVVKLLQKAINLSRTPMKLLIKAAFIQDHLKVCAISLPILVL